MKLLLIALILGCSACGKAIDPAFQPYVDHFQAEGNISASKITVQFADLSYLGPEIAGHCDYHGNITISKNYWDIRSDTAKEILIYHELGHCVLNREHKLDEDDHGIPKSVMFPDSLDPKAYSQNRASYISELFTGVSK